MNLTWHIVRKDLRRMALPVGIWLALQLVSTAAFGGMRMPSEPYRLGLPFTWAMTMQQMFLLAVVLLGFTGAVLAGFLAQDDSPAGTTAFWQTRPITGVRLMFAKIAGALLMLVVAPAAVLTIVWVGDGFSLRETWLAALEFMAWQIVFIVPALAIGAATSNLGRFLFTFGCVVVVFAIGLLISASAWFQNASSNLELERSRAFAMVVVILMGALAVLRWRYGSLRCRPAWILGATIAAMLVTSLRWSWDITAKLPWLGRSVWHAPHRAEPLPAEESAVQAQWEKLVLRDRPAELLISTAHSFAGGDVFAPTFGEVRVKQPTPQGNTMTYQTDRGGRWGEAVALRLAGLRKGDGPVSWGFAVGRFEEAVARLRESTEVLSGSVMKIARMHPRIMWEMPLKTGGEIRVGSSFTRIVDLSWIGGARMAVLQERDAWPAFVVGLRSDAFHGRRLDDHTIDCFLVVNRAQGLAEAASVEDLGVAVMSSVMLSVSGLRLPAGGDGGKPAAWEVGATLIKVRFERIDSDSFGYEVPGGPIAIVDETKP